MADTAMEYEFKTPVEYNGEKIAKLHIDFDKLTGDDALAIENELRAMNKIVILPSVDGEYIIRMLAKACKEPVGEDFFRGLGLADYNRLRKIGRDFLMQSE